MTTDCTPAVPGGDWRFTDAQGRDYAIAYFTAEGGPWTFAPTPLYGNATTHPIHCDELGPGWVWHAAVGRPAPGVSACGLVLAQSIHPKAANLAEALLDKIFTSDRPCPTVRDAMRLTRRSKEETVAALEVLTDHGYARPADPVRRYSAGRSDGIGTRSARILWHQSVLDALTPTEADS